MYDRSCWSDFLSLDSATPPGDVGYILKPSRPRNKSHGKEWGPVYKTLFFSSVLLPKVVAFYLVNTGKNEDIAAMFTCRLTVNFFFTLG